MTKLLLIILFFTLPLIHGKFFSTLGLSISIDVSGNFEFIKSIYFNILSTLIGIVFFIERILIQKSSVTIKHRLTIFLIVAIGGVSSIFGISPIISLFADIEKGHTFITLINITLLYIILSSEDSIFIKKLIKISIISLVLSAIIGIKELFFPTFNYQSLSSRIVGTFGHPNYFSGFALVLLPFILENKNSYKKIFFSCIVGSAVLLSQSLTAIFLLFLYIFYRNTKRYITTQAFLIGSLVLSILGISLLTLYFPEKLHSFISRFYLWETTMRIISSNLKILLIGGGSETLNILFNSFKSPELYIYENYGFTADRPHNLFLNIFYHYGFIGASVFIFLIYQFIKNWKYTPQHISVTLFLLYGVFQYYSISAYLILILCVSGLSTLKYSSGNILHSLSIAGILLVSIFGGYSSIKLLLGEIEYKQGNYIQAISYFPHPKYYIKTGDFENALLYQGIETNESLRRKISLGESIAQDCEDLIYLYPSVENHFYCGEKLENSGNIDQSKHYYNAGIQKLPDLWNQESPYWNRYFIKNTITGNRFFSEKFGDIKGVLEKLGK